MAVHAKRAAIANRVLETLNEFPGEEDQRSFLDTFLALSGLRSVSVAQQNSKTSKSVTDGSKGKTTYAKVAGAKPSNQVPVPEGPVPFQSSDDKGTTDPGEADASLQLVAAILSSSSNCQRQVGAFAPRMDHKSIKGRVTSNRKSTRRALKDLKELYPNITSSMEVVDLTEIKNLVNAVKSFRLVFQDAFTARYHKVNIGVDLAENFISLSAFEVLVVILEKSELMEDSSTGFWGDPNGVLSSTLSTGEPAKAPTNPYAYS